MKKLFIVLVCTAFLLCGCSEITRNPDITKKPDVTSNPNSEETNNSGSEETSNNNNSFSFNGKNYELTFSDEFESSKLDTKNWEYCPEQKRQDAGGWWSNECSTFENGNYVITCKLKDDGTPLSGGIRSRKKFEQTYGLYNIRFKVEKADGLWYAFWLMTDRMGDNTPGNGAVDGAEIDIIEVVPHDKAYYTTIHWDGYGENLKSKHPSGKRIDDSFYGKYHDLWFLWDKDGYKLYMDGTDSAHLIYDMPGKDYGEGTCQVPCYVKITAEYGKWAGEIKSEQLPTHFSVDYVRIYKEK